MLGKLFLAWAILRDHWGGSPSRASIFMFLLYVDASGVPELGAAPPTYAMVGLCLHEGAWFGWERRVNGLKRHYALPGADFELHAKEFCTQIVEQDEVPNFDLLDRPARRRAVLSLRREKLPAAGPGVESRRKRYRHFCPRGSCQCMICRERGHDIVPSHLRSTGP